ncbi:CPBP family intramembrane metalloprotease [bacterium]|nr:CPBP family intramembrane metalloprotease [bacterium]
MSRPLHIFIPREAYLLVAASMFLGFFVSLTFQGILSETENPVILDRLVILISEMLILLPPFFILKQRGIPIVQVLPLASISPITLVMAGVIVIGAVGLVSIFEVLVLPYFPIPDFLNQMEFEISQGGFWDSLVLIIAGSLVAPIVEEFIFRGILQQSLFYRYGSLIPAIVVPTVVFALFHVAYLYYLPAFLELLSLALLLSWLMVKTGNILIPVVVHGLFNLSSFTGLFIAEMEETASLGDLGLPWIILSIISAGAGWFYFKHMQLVEHDEVYLIPPLREKGF